MVALRNTVLDMSHAFESILRVVITSLLHRVEKNATFPYNFLSLPSSKMDFDLDEHLSSLPKKPYTDGWKEGEWENVK